MTAQSRNWSSVTGNAGALYRVAHAVANLGAGFLIPLRATSVAIDVKLNNVFEQAYINFLSRYKTYGAPTYQMGRNLVVRVRVE